MHMARSQNLKEHGLLKKFAPAGQRTTVIEQRLLFLLSTVNCHLSTKHGLLKKLVSRQALLLFSSRNASDKWNIKSRIVIASLLDFFAAKSPAKP